MKLITRDEIDEEEIRQFVTGTDQISFFQLPEFLHLLDYTKDYQGYWVGLREQESLVGSAVFYDIVHRIPITHISVRRRIITGGPVILATNKEQMTQYSETLIDAIINTGAKPLFIEIRNLFDISDIAYVFESRGFRFENHLDFLIDIAKGEETLLKEMTSSGRRMVKKALKGGLTAENAKDISEISKFYRILSSAYSRKKLPLADFSLFKGCYELLGEKHCRFLLAKDQSNNMVAGRLELIAGNTIYDWYAAAEPDSLSARPNELLVWAAIREGINLNLTTFDFGGAGKPEEEYGVREFKEKFGGQRVDFGRYILENRPIVTAVARKFMKIAMKFKRR